MTHIIKKGKIRNIILSSGAGSLIDRSMLEAALLKKFLLKIDVPDSVIFVDSLSDNTHENAVNTAKIINDKFPDGKFLLITSSIHMHRAIGCFEHEGVEVTPYSTCLITGEREFDIVNIIVPNMEALSHWDSLIHEVAGYLTYALIDYL